MVFINRMSMAKYQMQLTGEGKGNCYCYQRVHFVLAIFTKDFDNEFTRIAQSQTRTEAIEKAVFSLPPGGNGEQHDDTSPSAAEVLFKIQVRIIFIEKICFS